ncbi:hypothetical protein LJR290_007310 [Variovorax sp. LjRoot290]
MTTAFDVAEKKALDQLVGVTRSCLVDMTASARRFKPVTTPPPGSY